MVEIKNKMREIIDQTLKKDQYKKIFKQKFNIDKRIEKFQEYIFKRVKPYFDKQTHLAKNKPILENLLSIFFCVYSRTPLFLCGKPGSSKTLSTKLFIQSFSEEAFGENDIFKRFKPIK